MVWEFGLWIRRIPPKKMNPNQQRIPLLAERGSTRYHKKQQEVHSQNVQLSLGSARGKGPNVWAPTSLG